MNSSDRPVSSLLAARILEDAELIGEMLTLTPEGCGDWQPDWPPSIAGEPPFPMAQLSAHLAESLAGVCACLHRLYPVELAHFDKRNYPFGESKLFANCFKINDLYPPSDRCKRLFQNRYS